MRTPATPPCGCSTAGRTPSVRHPRPALYQCARVEVRDQRRSSDTMSESLVPTSRGGLGLSGFGVFAGRVTNPAAARLASRSESEVDSLGSLTIRATERPRSVMITSSPACTAATKLLSRAFVSLISATIISSPCDAHIAADYGNARQPPWGNSNDYASRAGTREEQVRIQRSPRYRSRKATVCRTASAVFCSRVRPERLRGLKPWSPSPIQCTVIAGDRS